MSQFAPGRRRRVAVEIIRALNGVSHGNRQPVGAPPIDDAPVVLDALGIEFPQVIDLEGGESVDAELLVDQEEGVYELRLLAVVHLVDLLGLREALCDVAPDPDDGGLVDPVDVEGNPVRLPKLERRQDPFSAGHGRLLGCLLGAPVRGPRRRCTLGALAARDCAGSEP
jgi:hypothetical protein